MYTEITIGNENYKLRLTTRNLIEVEKALGHNPLQMFMEIDNDVLPKLSDIAVLLHYSLQTFHHGISLEKTYDLIDKYLEDKTIWELVPVLLDVFKECGFVEKDADGDSKN